MPTMRVIELQRDFDAILNWVRASDGLFGAKMDLIAMIAATFCCQWATYWKVNAEQLHLDPVAVWHRSDFQAALLVRDTDGRQLSLSQGTAGHVWKSRKPVWSTNIVLDMCLPRSLDATKEGLDGGIWFAVKTNSAVYGIIELLGQKLGPASEKTLLAVEKFGMSLGQLIEEEHLRRLNANTNLANG